MTDLSIVEIEVGEPISFDVSLPNLRNTTIQLVILMTGNISEILHSSAPLKIGFSRAVSQMKRCVSIVSLHRITIFFIIDDGRVSVVSFRRILLCTIEDYPDAGAKRKWTFMDV